MQCECWGEFVVQVEFVGEFVVVIIVVFVVCGQIVGEVFVDLVGQVGVGVDYIV